MAKIDVARVAVRVGSAYPAPFAQMAKGRIKQALGDAGGLTQFGVNLVRLGPGEWSSQRHWHSHEDEFVWVLEGEATLITEAGAQIVKAGECAAFAKGVPDGHHLVNRSADPLCYLEVGVRHGDDQVEYPDVDLRATDAGYFHKDGRPY